MTYNNSKIFHHFYLVFLITINVSCQSNTDKNINKDVYLIKTFQIDSSGWGYDVYNNEKLIIHQPNIPAVDGNITFKTKENAQKTAELVLEKLKKNIFPPSLTKEEVERVNK